jgi:hypothetical protein
MEITGRAFELEPEVLSAPIQTHEGFNLLFVETHSPEIQQSFEQVKPDVLKSVRAIRLKELHQTQIEELKLGSEISIEQSTLDAFVLASESSEG